jgi:MFS family permease
MILRASMGFGESGFTSIAPTVLGDMYGPEQRTIVLALFYYAIPVGR